MNRNIKISIKIFCKLFKLIYFLYLYIKFIYIFIKYYINKYYIINIL